MWAIVAPASNARWVDSICSAGVVGNAGLSFLRGTEPVIATATTTGRMASSLALARAPLTIYPIARALPSARGRRSRRGRRPGATTRNKCLIGATGSVSRNSLLRSKRRNKFPARANKFPARRRREFVSQLAEFASVFETDFRKKRPNRRNSLHFSLRPGNLAQNPTDDTWTSD